MLLACKISTGCVVVQRSRNQGEGSPEFPNMRQNKGRVYTVKKAGEGEFGQ